MICLASVDYFSLQGIPFIILALFNIWMFQPLATLLHELGHGVFALWLTKEEVVIRVGEPKKFKRSMSIQPSKRFAIEVSLLNTRVGNTQFVETPEKWGKALVLFGGPLFSFLLVWQAGYLLFFNNPRDWVELLLVSWFCSNLLALFRAVVPVKLQPTKAFPDGPPSDGLQLYRLLFDQPTHSK